LQRREAVQVLREICKCIPDESVVTCVFLEQTRNAADSRKNSYELHIKMNIDEATRENIESATRKHGLSVRASNEDFIVYALEERMEIVA
jgi:hypothetical protein